MCQGVVFSGIAGKFLDAISLGNMLLAVQPREKKTAPKQRSISVRTNCETAVSKTCFYCECKR